MKNKAFNSIRSRILIYTVGIIFLFTSVLAGVMFYATFSNTQQTLTQESETSLLYVASSINDNIDSILSFVLSGRISKHITDYALSTQDDSSIKVEAHNYLQDTYTANSNLRDIMIRMVVVSDNRNDIIQCVEPVYSTANVTKDRLLSQPFFNQALLDGDDPTCGIIADPFLPHTNVEIIPFVYKLFHPYKADAIGYVYAELSTTAFTAPLANALPEEYEHYFIRMGKSIYEFRDGALLLTENDYLSNLELSSNGFTIIRGKDVTGVNSLTVATPLGIHDWYVIKSTDTTGISDSFLSAFGSILAVVLIFSIIVGVIYYGLLSKMVNIPVQKLTERIGKIQEGDFTRDSETEWNNELGDIGRTINDLSENVNNLLNQRIEDEKQKKDYQYQILQNQVNPHFLYNTLNSIKWMATIQNAPGIAEMTTALSRLLKDISKGAQSHISLEHELSLVNDYFTIQKYRYGGIISLTTDVESEDLLKCQILRFTLQPLIENAIFHGIEPKGTAGTITIKVYRKEDVYIEVIDDGVGMDEETAKACLNETKLSSSSFFKEIGIGNVHKRHLYEYGEGYGLSIDSKVGEYTKITICMPYQTKEFLDENINS